MPTKSNPRAIPLSSVNNLSTKAIFLDLGKNPWWLEKILAKMDRSKVWDPAIRSASEIRKVF